MKPQARRAAADAVAILQDNKAGQISYLQHGLEQSMADPNGISLADYIHAIFGLLLQAKVRDVLLIGCGGGTLATMLRARRVKVTMLDINETSFAIARQHFRLPPSVKCHVADGCAFLAASAHRYDAIVLDAYSRDSIPRQFQTKAFMSLAASRLTRRGFLIANVMADGARDRKVRRLTRLMESAWANVRVLSVKGRAHGNVLVMGGAISDFKRPQLVMPPATGRTLLRTELAALRFV